MFFKHGGEHRTSGKVSIGLIGRTVKPKFIMNDLLNLVKRKSTGFLSSCGFFLDSSMAFSRALYFILGGGVKPPFLFPQGSPRCIYDAAPPDDSVKYLMTDRFFDHIRPII